MLPSDAMPTTTVTKMTGPVTVLISWMNASASHSVSLAMLGATRPSTMPAAIATSTQNQSWVHSRRLRRSCAGGVPLSRRSGAVAELTSSVTAAR